MLVAVVAGGEERDKLGSAALQAVEERAYFRTIEEQGGRSHASGTRPELGRVIPDDRLREPVGAIRVGLTPTAFGADGGVLAEYDGSTAHHHSAVEVSGTRGMEVVDLGSQAVVLATSAGELVRFRRGAGPGVAFDGPRTGQSGGPLRVRPWPRGSLVVASMRRLNRQAPLQGGSFPLTPPAYRGELEILASTTDASRLRLVNVLDVEDYVPGVVANESLSTFHLEALKAQAVAARGYVLANRGRFADRAFDVDDSTLSQVYRGRYSETSSALAASRQTWGLTVVRGGRLVTALYSSSMGGHTESNEFVFPAGGYPGANADPALRGVHDSARALAFDLASADGVLRFYSSIDREAFETDPATGQPLTSLHRWVRTRNAAELLARLKESFGVPLSASRLLDLRTILRGASGRTMRLELRGDWGVTVVTGWSDLRRLATLTGTAPGGTSSASAPNCPSAHEVSRGPSGEVASVMFFGGGFGHNVGMSQYGAHGRALRGQGVEAILADYYTGAELATPPIVVTARAVLEHRFFAPSRRAVLVVEDASLAELEVRVGAAGMRLRPEPGRRLGADLSDAVRPGLNTVRVAAVGPGSAVVSVRVAGQD